MENTGTTTAPAAPAPGPAAGDLVGLGLLGLFVVAFGGLAISALTRKRRQNLEALTEVLEKQAAESPAGPEGTPTAQEDQRADEQAARTESPVPAAPARSAETRAAYQRGLERTRTSFFGKLTDLLSGTREIDENVIAELEPLLIQADVGIKTTTRLLETARERLARGDLHSADKVKEALRAEILRMVSVPAPDMEKPSGKPHVLMVVGVNGVGKTTTIGKLASRFRANGHGVVLGAGDTFRAAAVDQLKIWGDRAGCVTVEGADGSDSASVLFEAIKRGKTDNADYVICDTAGRLHTKVNLMEELKKVNRVIGKAHEGAPHEVLLVVDGTTGQNALVQAEQFNAALKLSGVVLTKLDGTAKGGIIIAIADQLKLPIRYVGVGEKLEDLRPFDAEAFVDGLFGA